MKSSLLTVRYFMIFVSQMKINTSILATIAFSIFAGGCVSPHWTEKQKASLTSVGLKEIQIAKEAYHEPNARGNSPGMAQTLPTATGGGFLPSLIGSAIDASIQSSRQSKFEKSAKQYFDAIESVYSDAPEEELKIKIEESLQNDAFFGAIYASDATSFFDIEILSYGFVRHASYDEENLTMCYQIVGRVKLITTDKKMLMDEVLTSTTGRFALIEDIASGTDAELYKSDAVAVFADALIGRLAFKLNR